MYPSTNSRCVKAKSYDIYSPELVTAQKRIAFTAVQNDPMNTKLIPDAPEAPG